LTQQSPYWDNGTADQVIQLTADTTGMTGMIIENLLGSGNLHAG
jgi:hypothetical protein